MGFTENFKHAYPLLCNASSPSKLIELLWEVPSDLTNFDVLKTLRNRESIIWSTFSRAGCCTDRPGSLCTPLTATIVTTVGSSSWVLMVNSTLARYINQILFFEILHIFSYIFETSSMTWRYFVVQKQRGAFQHSSFLAGGATIAAGRLSAHHGVLQVSIFSKHNATSKFQSNCVAVSVDFLEEGYNSWPLFLIASP